jgi:hypothetical protein
VGSFSIETDPANVDFQIGIADNLNGSDSYSVTSFNNVGTTEPGPGVQLISWGLTDSTGTALKNDHLQKMAPVLSSWPFNQLEIEGRPDAFYRIRAHVTQAVTV